MTTPKLLPKTSGALAPRTFRASPSFIRWPAGLVVFNFAVAAIAVHAHQIKPAPLFGTMGLAFLIVLISAATLQVTMDADGLAQRWIWGRRRIAWEVVASIERVRRALLGDGLFLLDDKNKEIFAVSALPLAAQELITAEAIKRARLRKDKAAPRRPVVARWVRK